MGGQAYDGGMGGLGFGAQGLAQNVIQVLTACYGTGGAKALEEPLNRLVRAAPSHIGPNLQRAAQQCVERATAFGNPAQAGPAIADFLDLCFTDEDPTAFRQHFERILAAFTDNRPLYERLYAAVVAASARADGRAIVEEKKTQSLELRLRAQVEEQFLRSERASMLVQQLHQEAAAGRGKKDAANTHGVTWYEPESGREVRRAFVLDKAIGPKLKRLIAQLRRRFVYMDIGIRAPVRVLMDGPPGTGKTMAARYIASYLGKPCAVMRLDEIVGKLIGDTAKNITSVLEAAVARKAVLFLDEVDGLFPPRDGDLTGSGGEELRRITSAFLQQVNLLPKKQIVICATNRRDALDSAFLRRFPDTLTFTYPDSETRGEIVRRTWNKLRFDPVAHGLLVERTHETSGDHVTVVAMAAARIAADLLLDDDAVMAEVEREAAITAEATLEAARVEAQRRAEEETKAGKAPAAHGLPADASDAEITEAVAKLEADRVGQVAKAKKGAMKAAVRKGRRTLLRARVLIARSSVDQALHETPPPPVYLARDRSGKPIPMPARPGSSILMP